MFVDRVRIFVKGGDGGRGCVSFRHEPHVPRGGPDGGAGGAGGSIALIGTSHHNTLYPLRFHSEFRAPRGRHGSSSNRSGRSGQDLLVPVPPGTLAFEDVSGEQLGEVLAAGERLVVARGGRGGRGNRAFLSNRNRAPREAEPGVPGEERWLRLELRLIADVGFLGCPNAGKSTLLSCISAARPKVASYPFTTLSPVLGMVDVDGAQLVAADIPGIIEGARHGAGLGLQFLRHVQRTRALVHVVDTGAGSEDGAVAAFRMVREEVRLWNPELLEKPQVVAATKRDVVDQDHDPLPGLREEASGLGLGVVPVSSVSGLGLKELKREMARLVACAAGTQGRPA
jgi:GTP-binding protein